MHIVICTLTLRSGAVVTAKMKAQSPELSYPIEYSGPAEALPSRPERADVVEMKMLFQLMAESLDADLKIYAEGDFELWAE
jgi:hypothetical protein